MGTLEMNDGTVYEGNCFVSNNALLVYFEHMTLPEGFALLTDSSKTVKIKCTQYGEEMTFRGYTHLYTMTENPGGMLSAGLLQG